MLGFNTYAASYMSRVVNVGGTTPGVLIQQAFEDLSVAVYKAFRPSGSQAPPLAAYPFYGGSAESHLLNLFGTDFEISWIGTLTHGSNGVNGNGTDSYGLTGVNPILDMDITSCAMGIYIRTNSAADVYDMGARTSATNAVHIRGRIAAGNAVGALGGASNTSVAVAASTGLFVVEKRASLVLVLYRNGVTIDSNSTASATLPNVSFIAIGASAGIGPLSSRQFAFAFVSQRKAPDGAVDHLALYTAVQAYETALGRAV